jgi:serine/threonine protein kinase
MAKVIAIGQPINEAERQAIAYLRDHLPNTCTILHNFELAFDKEVWEIDLAILTPHAVYVVDVKGTSGQIEVFGSQWYPEGRSPFFSPLAKVRQHAKTLKELIKSTHPHRFELNDVYVHAAVVLTAPNAQFIDSTGRDAPDVVPLSKSLLYFMDKTRLPPGRGKDISALLGLAQSVIQGKARPRNAPRQFKHWQVEEKLGETKDYTDYRASNIFAGKLGRAPGARLRVYHTDPYADLAARQAHMRLISNAYRALSQLPPHPNILTVRDFFVSEDETECVLVTDDFPGDALRKYLARPQSALTFDQKLRLLRGVLAGLGHAHQYEVYHRNLTPDAILLSADGQVRLTAFDYARAQYEGRETIQDEIIEKIDWYYQAPECRQDGPGRVSAPSELFAAGQIFFRLLTGEAAFADSTQPSKDQPFLPSQPTALKPDLPTGFDEWLQKLCAFDPVERYPSALAATEALENVLSLAPSTGYKTAPTTETPPPPAAPDLKDLKPDMPPLGGRFIIQDRLGEPGAFGVAYKVFDTFGEVNRVLKLILHNRGGSTLDRLRQEYRVLSSLPDHPNVVKVIWADRLAELQDTPYVVFEYVDGYTVEEFIKAQALSLEDARTIARQSAQGLSHLHNHGVYHQDIKPSNVLWTDRGVRLIDFNMAKLETDDGPGGGTRRYLPPDFDSHMEPTTAERVDRDLYALAVTFYESLTSGSYPFETKTPELHTRARDPRQISGLHDLNPAWVNWFNKALDPQRHARFTSAAEFLAALNALPEPRLKPAAPLATSNTPVAAKPNTNPFVTDLLTLYSQSQRTNAGTRGLNAISSATYVETLLDTQLRAAVLSGEFHLVVITGNAGDGKTAFIQQIERQVEAQGATVQRGLNGATFTWHGRVFRSNYDGSQDEGDKDNTAVLLEFLAPFAGDDESAWQSNETRLIAINEGRLVDFLDAHEAQFSRLIALIHVGLRGEDIVAPVGVAVINLNLRAVVADPDGANSSIFDRLLRRFTDPKDWDACLQCDLRSRCYVHHNARTFADPVAGPKVIERLKMLYTATHLRGRLHITLRDLRSALAYTLVGTRDCDELHTLYAQGPGALPDILSGFYFNAWHGGRTPTHDRLLQLLRDLDIGEVSTPELDRAFDFLEPKARKFARFEFSERDAYEDELFARLFQSLDRAGNNADLPAYFQQHREYVAMLRRRHYFERRDDAWIMMLPYRQMERFLEMVTRPAAFAAQIDDLLAAINRGEGLADPETIKHRLALRVRVVDRGTVRSYRLFDGNSFQPAPPLAATQLRFLEYMPPGVVLRYVPAVGRSVELLITLDIYEMLARLNAGYRPSPEERHGLYRTLAVFKNMLASAPYQEVLLTESGHEFYQMRREANSVLTFRRLKEGELT